MKINPDKLSTNQEDCRIVFVEIPDSEISYTDRIKIFPEKVIEKTGLRIEKIRDFSVLPTLIKQIILTGEVNRYNINEIVEDMRKITNGIYPSLFTDAHTISGDISSGVYNTDSWIGRGGHFQDIIDPRGNIIQGAIVQPGSMSNIVSEVGDDGQVKKWHFNFYTAPWASEYIFQDNPTFCIDGKNEGLKDYYNDLISNYPDIVIDSLALEKERFNDVEKMNPLSVERIKQLRLILIEIQEFLLTLDDEEKLKNFLSPTEDLEYEFNQPASQFENELDKLILRALFKLEKEKIIEKGGFVDFRKMIKKLQPIVAKLSDFFDLKTDNDLTSIKMPDAPPSDLRISFLHIKEMIYLWALVRGYVVGGIVTSFYDKETRKRILEPKDKVGWHSEKIIPIFGHPKIRIAPKWCNITSCMLDLKNKRIRFYNPSE